MGDGCPSGPSWTRRDYGSDAGEPSALWRRLSWYLRQPPVGESRTGLVAWWEKRRLLFNGLAAATGLASWELMLWAAHGSGWVDASQDVVEPALLWLAPIAINIGYTIIWLVDLALRERVTLLSGALSTWLLLGVTLFTLALEWVPTALWLSVRFLQAVGLLD